MKIKGEVKAGADEQKNNEQSTFSRLRQDSLNTIHV
jgi:hypothetical protein